jgi:hypothetical protein
VIQHARIHFIAILYTYYYYLGELIWLPRTIGAVKAAREAREALQQLQSNESNSAAVATSVCIKYKLISPDAGMICTSVFLKRKKKQNSWRTKKQNHSNNINANLSQPTTYM